MPLYEFQCSSCNQIVEDITPYTVNTVECSSCGKPANKIFRDCAKVLTTIIPAHKGSLKRKAGYCHTHGDKPATKVQSGWGGCSNPPT